MTLVEHIKKMTYWMSNPDWYDYDGQGNPYLTEAAPSEAVESFKYNQMKHAESVETGIICN